MKRALVLACVAGGLVCASSANAEPWQKAIKRRLLVATNVNNPTDAFPFSDNFDSYPTGTFPCTGGGCAGPNGWSIWATGGNPANISTAQSASPPNSMEATALSDIVQTGDITSGSWTIKAKTYFPSAATGTPRELYFIVMDGYQGNAGQTNHWSIQVRMDGDTGVNQVISDVQGTVCPTGAVCTPQTLVYDQWVEIRAEINLTTDKYDIFYNNLPVVTNHPYSTGSGTAGTVRIACLDLYSNGVAGAFWDDVVMQAAVTPPSCYANCDSSTSLPFLNVNDFICFQQKYAAGDTYANCDNSTTAPVLNVNDFICFQTAFAAGCSAP